MARGKFHGPAYRRTCGDGRDRYSLALVRTTTSVITRLSLRDKIRVEIGWARSRYASFIRWFERIISPGVISRVSGHERLLIPFRLATRHFQLCYSLYLARQLQLH